MKNLAKLRRAANLTQQDFANISGYSKRQIQRFENGHKLRKATLEWFKYLLLGVK